MANSSIIRQQAAYTASHHLLVTQQEPYKTTYLFMKEMMENVLEKGQENGPLANKNKTNKKDRKSKRIRQQNKRDRKWGSNRSPEIPDRRMTSDTLEIPSEKKKKEPETTLTDGFQENKYHMYNTQK